MQPPPRLKAYGAEARALVPFAKALAHKWLDPGDVFEQTVILAGDALMACYDCLSHDQIFARDLLKKAQRGVLQLYGGVGGQVTPSSVEDQAQNPYFQHMCEVTESLPRESWTYRDEDFGGFLAGLSRSRGAARSPQAVATRVLTKFVANNPVPSL